MPKPKVSRTDLKPGEVLCAHCTAKCCRYFAVPLETPKTAKDFDYFRWYMIHGNVAIFVDGTAWYLMIRNPCDHLQSDHRCGIYQDRPQICRNYSTNDCEYDGEGFYDMFFECPEQLLEFAEAFLPPVSRSAPNSERRPIQLPILNPVDTPAKPVTISDAVAS